MLKAIFKNGDRLKNLGSKLTLVYSTLDCGLSTKNRNRNNIVKSDYSSYYSPKPNIRKLSLNYQLHL